MINHVTVAFCYAVDIGPICYMKLVFFHVNMKVDCV